MYENKKVVYKFEKLIVWDLSLDLNDQVYHLSGQLPKEEKFNLTQQFLRAANSVSLNIAEGSTGMTDKEQVRFLRIALRSLIETIACTRIMIRRRYLTSSCEEFISFDKLANELFIRLNAFIKSLLKN